ncbi:hypothetical protein CPB86DRAFT_779995 [Serendipita vermifera]|nr:hypothetical protein CPB86DRAFT_779995 [Serendipita vermifera]
MFATYEDYMTLIGSYFNSAGTSMISLIIPPKVSSYRFHQQLQGVVSNRPSSIKRIMPFINNALDFDLHR